MQILILNGPNLNLLGQRETSVYGTQTLGEIESMLRRSAARHVRLDFMQSNHEGALIDALQQAPRKYQGVVFNPGGYAHTSVALRDTIAAIPIPVIEVHLSNIHGREEFRSRSITAGACAGMICGLGALGYQAAIETLERIISRGEGRAESRAPRSEEKPAEKQAERREEREHEEESEADRENRRRRRGRRGGRGRRRSEETEGGEEERDTSEEERPVVDIEAKYANLPGATIRRGLDVLAEDEENGESELPVGQVTFVDMTVEEPKGDTPERVEPRPVRPTEKEPARPVVARVEAPSDEEEMVTLKRTRVTGSRRAAAEAEPGAAAEEKAGAAAEPAPTEEPKPASDSALSEEAVEAAEAALGLDEPEDNGKPAKKAAKKSAKRSSRKSTKKTARKAASAGNADKGEAAGEDE